eukprot:TRINITY_DN48483_c0_g1_i1.p1 TRINITY_DN48483_c0_g1~~TRINITY_DN48483_c0_g1_i1.p1  ORF type:complete len:208 (-),score=40.69 TRINITY_DN48483_c0_g1_i1:186-758(-)
MAPKTSVSGGDGHPVLCEIREAQESSAHGYKQALEEIKRGNKRSHWIWYVWPCLAGVRETSRPQYSLPDLESAKAFVADGLLRERLLEITEVAVTHLNNKVQPSHLFGSGVDVEKFHETMTCFVVVALDVGDGELADVCLSALHALGGQLEEKTMSYVSSVGGLTEYSHVRSADELAAEMRKGKEEQVEG